MPKMKECSKCKRIKPLLTFNKDKRSSDGLRSECKLCHDKMVFKSLERRIKEREDAENKDVCVGHRDNVTGKES